MNRIQEPSFLPLAGRIFISLIFILSGLAKLVQWHIFMQMLANKLIPFDALSLSLAAAVEILGGLSILLGFKARYSGIILFLYLLPTTLIFHNFWALGGEQFANQFALFLKNLAIMGGMLYIAHYGAGPFSIDNRMQRG